MGLHSIGDCFFPLTCTCGEGHGVLRLWGRVRWRSLMRVSVGGLWLAGSGRIGEFNGG